MAKISPAAIIGQRFGRLVGLREDGRIRREVAYAFRCDCGTDVRIGSYAVRSSAILSCGCTQHVRALRGKGRRRVERLPRFCSDVRLRFSAKWMPEPNTGCWLWLGAASDGMGYGTIGEVLPDGSRKSHHVHRLSYEIHVGPIPAGMEILHRCDTPLCVNPDHLSVGTHTDNMRDCVAKGRARGRLSRPETLLGSVKTARPSRSEAEAGQ